MRHFVVILSAILVVFPMTSSLQAQQCDDNLWTGGDPDPWWTRTANWSRGHPPTATETVVFDIPSDTLMDLAGGISWPAGNPWKICSWSVETGGLTELGAHEFMNAADATALSILGDVVVPLADYATLLNTYDISVGPLDGVFVGDGMWDHPPVLDAETFGIEWFVEGVEIGNDKAIVGVTGRIGGGRWTASRSRIGLGINLSDGDFTWGEWYVGADGTIDSEYPAVGPTGSSDWTLDMVELLAKRCQNLGDWTINHSEMVTLQPSATVPTPEW